MTRLVVYSLASLLAFAIATILIQYDHADFGVPRDVRIGAVYLGMLLAGTALNTAVLSEIDRRRIGSEDIGAWRRLRAVMASTVISIVYVVWCVYYVIDA